MAYLVAGPLVALIGIGAVFFVLRRKSVETRSMYSARRSQIEHKVRAARQRTLAPHGHAPKAPEAEAAPPVSPFDQPQVQPTVVYEVPAYQAPPAAPPSAPPARPAQAPEQMPWEQPSIPAPAQAPSSFDYPIAQPEPYTPAPEPFRPAPEPTPMPGPSEPVWTPAPRPAEPLPPGDTIAPAASTVAPAASSSAAAGWSVVTTEKDSAATAEPAAKKKKSKGGAEGGSQWALASGDAPGMESDEPEVARSSGSVRAVAQYAVLVVGLVMVLIGVLVMVANSHVT